MWIGYVDEYFAQMFAEQDEVKYYKSDGTLDEENLKVMYEDALAFDEGKNLLKSTTEETFRLVWEIKQEVKELSELFSGSDCILYNTRVYETLEGNLRLVFEHIDIKNLNFQ